MSDKERYEFFSSPGENFDMWWIFEIEKKRVKWTEKKTGLVKKKLVHFEIMWLISAKTKTIVL